MNLFEERSEVNVTWKNIFLRGIWISHHRCKGFVKCTWLVKIKTAMALCQQWKAQRPSLKLSTLHSWSSCVLPVMCWLCAPQEVWRSVACNYAEPGRLVSSELGSLALSFSDVLSIDLNHGKSITVEEIECSRVMKCPSFDLCLAWNRNLKLHHPWDAMNLLLVKHNIPTKDPWIWTERFVFHVSLTVVFHVFGNVTPLSLIL